MKVVIHKTNIEYSVKYYPNVKIFRELYPHATVEGDKLANYEVSSESKFRAKVWERIQERLDVIYKNMKVFGVDKLWKLNI